MQLTIDEFCRKCFIAPFNLSENEVIRTFWYRDRYQCIQLGGIEFYLYLKRFTNFFILIKVIWSNSNFSIEEVYKIYDDLFDGQNVRKADLLSLLKSFYERNGMEVDFAGSKSRFFLNHSGIGIPKLPPNMTFEEKNFYIWLNFVRSPVRHTLGESQIKCCSPILTINEGNHVDFLDVHLYYEINPDKYNQYLSR